MKKQVLTQRVYKVSGHLLSCMLFILPFVVLAQNRPPGLPNPLQPAGINNLHQLVIAVAVALQKLGVPFLIFSFVSSGFVLVVMRGGKPEERKEWLIRLGFLGGAGLVMLAAPTIAQILYNTCKALGACP